MKLKLDETINSSDTDNCIVLRLNPYDESMGSESTEIMFFIDECNDLSEIRIIGRGCADEIISLTEGDIEKFCNFIYSLNCDDNSKNKRKKLEVKADDGMVSMLIIPDKDDGTMMDVALFIDEKHLESISCGSVKLMQGIIKAITDS